MSIVADNIRAYCEEYGHSRASFERLCDLSNGLVGKWEDGQRSPTVTTLQKISQKTGIDMDVWLKEGGINARQEHKGGDGKRRHKTA